MIESEKLIAAFLASAKNVPEPVAKERKKNRSSNMSIESSRQFHIALSPIDSRAQPALRPGRRKHAYCFFISSPTGQQVKRPSVGSEGFVLNHYDRGAVELTSISSATA